MKTDTPKPVDCIPAGEKIEGGLGCCPGLTNCNGICYNPDTCDKDKYQAPYETDICCNPICMEKYTCGQDCCEPGEDCLNGICCARGQYNVNGVCSNCPAAPTGGCPQYATYDSQDICACLCDTSRGFAETPVNGQCVCANGSQPNANGYCCNEPTELVCTESALTYDTTTGCPLNKYEACVDPKTVCDTDNKTCICPTCSDPNNMIQDANCNCTCDTTKGFESSPVNGQCVCANGSQPNANGYCCNEPTELVCNESALTYDTNGCPLNKYEACTDGKICGSDNKNCVCPTIIGTICNATGQQYFDTAKQCPKFKVQACTAGRTCGADNTCQCPTGSLYDEKYEGCIATVQLNVLKSQKLECASSAHSCSYHSELQLVFPNDITTGRWKPVDSDVKFKIRAYVYYCGHDFDGQFSFSQETINLTNKNVFSSLAKKQENNLIHSLIYDGHINSLSAACAYHGLHARIIETFKDNKILFSGSTNTVCFDRDDHYYCSNVYETPPYYDSLSQQWLSQYKSSSDAEQSSTSEAYKTEFKVKYLGK